MKPGGAEMHDVLTDSAKDTVALYVTGLLASEAGADFERHVDGGCVACREELRALNSVMGMLSLAAPLATAPARLRDRIRQIPRASRVVRSDEGVWKAFGPGMVTKDLDFDAATGNRTFLLKMEPGAAIPPHHHAGVEQCYVVAGEAIVTGMRFGAGDYLRESAGTDHAAVRTETGCLLLLMTLG
jgi:anti-sigma factor ChrR (cupin superfamily)